MEATADPALNFWIDEAHHAHVQLEGTLDACSGRWLADLTEAAGAMGVRRLVVELSRVAGFDEEGAAALRRCRSIAAAAATAVTFRGGSGPAHQLLLASMASG